LVGERGFEFLSREPLILAESLQVSELKTATTFAAPKRSPVRTHLDTKLRETYRKFSERDLMCRAVLERVDRCQNHF
jgi:hypothetical protein